VAVSLAALLATADYIFGTSPWVKQHRPEDTLPLAIGFFGAIVGVLANFKAFGSTKEHERENRSIVKIKGKIGWSPSIRKMKRAWESS
jgi:hypothetical protein